MLDEVDEEGGVLRGERGKHVEFWEHNFYFDESWRGNNWNFRGESISLVFLLFIGKLKGFYKWYLVSVRGTEMLPP